MHFAFKNCADVHAAKYNALPMPFQLMLPSVTQLFFNYLIINTFILYLLQFFIIGNVYLNHSTHYLVWLYSLPTLHCVALYYSIS